MLIYDFILLSQLYKEVAGIFILIAEGKAQTQLVKSIAKLFISVSLMSCPISVV